jgi:hypothetical protein
MKFESNALLKAYYEKQRTNAKKLMWLGPLGAYLIFYWLFNILGFTLNFMACLIASYAAFFTFVYYGTLFADAKFMNRLVDKCIINEKEFIFITLKWFLNKEVSFHTSTLIELKRLEVSFFKQVGDVYKLTVLNKNKIEHLYIISRSFDDFEMIKTMMRF